MLRTLAALCLAVLVLGLVPQPVAARSTDEIKAEINAKKEQLNALEAQINDARGSKKEVEAVLAQYQTEYNELLALIDEQESAIALKENEVEFKTQQIALTVESIAKNQQLFASRLRAIYDMNGTGAMLGMLLSVDSYTDFVVASDAMKHISENDTQLLKDLAKEKEDYETRKVGLEADLAQLDVELEGLNADREWCHQKMQEMQGKIQIINAEIAAGLAESKKTEAEVQELQAEYNRVFAAQQAKGSQAGDASVRHDGPLAWPVAGGGRISSWFGDPRANTGYHYGIDICAPEGTPVLAAAPGTVITAEAHYSYGNYIVIDHGQGLRTLYAHNSFLSVGVGAQVNTGDQIAGMGSTGDSSANHVHFEVHDGGARQNPAAPQYLNIG